MIKNTVKLLLVIAMIVPLKVNASKKIVEIEELNNEMYLQYAGRINTGYSNFVLFKRDYETNDETFYRFDWNNNKTLLSNFNDDVLKTEEDEYINLDYLNGSTSVSLSGDLIMEEDPSNPGSYRYSSIFNGVSRLSSSDYIYSSSSKGENIGSVLEYQNLYVYKLTKTEGGADYVTETGKIVFSTQNNDETDYAIISHNDSVITFKNDTNIIMLYYIDTSKESFVVSKVTVSKIKNLLNTDNLTGIYLTANIKSTQGNYYFEVILNNRVYFINFDATEILFEREINPNEICVYYGINYNNKDYIFADIYDTNQQIQIATEVFDLNGKKYYDDSEWLNLYFTRYGSLFGVKEISNKYYAIFINANGTEIYRKEITDIDVGESYSNFYGEILTSDHDTGIIDDGKYLIQFTNKNYNGNFFIKYEIMSVFSKYSVIEGAKQTYILGSNKSMTFKINANKDLFNKLYVNGIELDSSNYTVTKGSTVITLSSKYLNTLKNGTYELKSTFINNEVVTTEFIINKSVINPKTGDGIMSNIFLGIVSLAGLLGISLYLKKKRCN